MSEPSEQELLARFNVTAEQLDEWADEYENTDWTHMKFGRPGKEGINSQPVNGPEINDLREKLAECFTGAEFACRREPLHEIKLNVEIDRAKPWCVHVANRNFSTMMEIFNRTEIGDAAAELYFPESVEESKISATALFLITDRDDPKPGRRWEIQFSHQEDTEEPLLRLKLPCARDGWYRVRIVRQALNQVGEPIGEEETYEYDLS